MKEPIDFSGTPSQELVDLVSGPEHLHQPTECEVCDAAWAVLRERQGDYWQEPGP